MDDMMTKVTTTAAGRAKSLAPDAAEAMRRMGMRRGLYEGNERTYAPDMKRAPPIAPLPIRQFLVQVANRDTTTVSHFPCVWVLDGFNPSDPRSPEHHALLQWVRAVESTTKRFVFVSRVGEVMCCGLNETRQTAKGVLDDKAAAIIAAHEARYRAEAVQVQREIEDMRRASQTAALESSEAGGAGAASAAGGAGGAGSDDPDRITTKDLDDRFKERQAAAAAAAAETMGVDEAAAAMKETAAAAAASGATATSATIPTHLHPTVTSWIVITFFRDILPEAFNSDCPEATGLEHAFIVHGFFRSPEDAKQFVDGSLPEASQRAPTFWAEVCSPMMLDMVDESRMEVYSHSDLMQKRLDYERGNETVVDQVASYAHRTSDGGVRASAASEAAEATVDLLAPIDSEDEGDEGDKGDKGDDAVKVVEDAAISGGTDETKGTEDATMEDATVEDPETGTEPALEPEPSSKKARAPAKKTRAPAKKARAPAKVTEDDAKGAEEKPKRRRRSTAAKKKTDEAAKAPVTTRRRSARLRASKT